MVAIVVRVTLDEWNERYRSREEIGGQPASLLVDAAQELAPGRALDLACGAGRNALWLASRGWEVTAIDGAEEAIRLVRGHEPAIDARVLDLEIEAPLPFPDQSFDLVAILYYLHRPLFAEAKRVVKRRGVVVVAVKMRGTYRVKPGELAQHFEEFEVLRSSEGEIAELVARRR
ncbi:MAG TPA: class I SAM-dependent methyltransferase [Thermoanaerobaculia bacterium]